MIGITGANGFIGLHLRAAMQAHGCAARLADRNTFRSPGALQAFAEACDVVVHLAGINRDADESRLQSENIKLAMDLVKACSQAKRHPAIVFASSTHVDLKTPYGQAKRQCTDIFSSYAATSGACFANVVLPHVFGEYARPNYNSAVATFCHQVSKGEPARVDRDAELKLLHAQDAAAIFLELAQAPRSVDLRPEGRAIKVSEVLAAIKAIHAQYSGGQMPDLGEPFTRDLFNTYRSYLKPETLAMTVRSDQRGSLFEVVKGGGSGQTFCSSTRQGFVRGNHFHLRKVERFAVLRGEAVIKLRRLYSDVVTVLRVTGDRPAVVDIPTLSTHSIENVGEGELLTLFWANEIFDVARPDTYAEAV